MQTLHLLTLDLRLPFLSVWLAGLANCASASTVASQKENLLAK